MRVQVDARGKSTATPTAMPCVDHGRRLEPSVGLLVPPEVFAQPPVERKRYLDHAADAGVAHLAVGDHVSFHVGIGFDGSVQATALLAAQERLPVFDRYVPQGTPIDVAERLAELAEAGPLRST